MDITYLNSMRKNFDFFTANIGDITPIWDDIRRNDGVVGRTIKSIQYRGHEYDVGERFIISFCSKFGIGTSIFYLFDPGEVFERIQLVHPRTRIRIVTDRNKCLAATSPSKPFVTYDTLMDIFKPARAGKIIRTGYRNGIVKTTHRLNEAPWEINGEIFYQTFTLEVPIDGYGLPSIYLSLIRQSNNTLLIAESKIFRSEIQLGKLDDYTKIPIERILDTFNNEEGFQALRQRLESAQNSSASLNECNNLLKIMSKNINFKNAIPFYQAYHNMTGDVSKKYGIATTESISSKKTRLLPMDCRVLDLIFFNMEITTKLNNLIKNIKPFTTWIGQIINNEYDLEGSLIKNEDT